LTIRSFSDKPKNIQINCVDINSKELIYAWLIRVQTKAPNITQVKKVTCKLNTVSV